MMVPFNGALLFVEWTEPDSAGNLWITDGTDEATEPLTFFRQPDVGVDLSTIVASGDLAYFTAISAGGQEQRWRTDGTRSGTTPVPDEPSNRQASTSLDSNDAE